MPLHVRALLVAFLTTMMIGGVAGAVTGQTGTAVVYVCPMHADVRGGPGDRCPKCGMALVRLVTGDYRPYPLDVTFSPSTIPARENVTIHFAVQEPHTGEPVRRFAVVHERVFHLFVVSQDLEYFAHEHPTLQPDGSLDLNVRLPSEGVYQLIADFLPEGGAPQFIQRSFVTQGYHGRLGTIPQLTADLEPKVVGDLRVALTTPEPIAGREQLLTFQVQDKTTGAPVRDLEPYLGAMAHLLVVSADNSIAFHSHPVPELSPDVGPTIVFQVLFPREGAYRIWSQFQRHGDVSTASFTIRVSAPQRR